jgi:GNAT superfamily N-acetyltransferase
LVTDFAGRINWNIRPARVEDALRLTELAERTFRDAFGPLNTPSDIESYCAGAFSREIQLNEIRNPVADTLVVEKDNGLIAYAQLVPSAPPTCVVGAVPIELKRFYVLQTLHGGGLAPVLMDAITRCAFDRGADVVWLGVWERNARAHRFYEKCGFRDVGEHRFLLGADEQRDVVMVKRIMA